MLVTKAAAARLVITTAVIFLLCLSREVSGSLIFSFVSARNFPVSIHIIAGAEKNADIAVKTRPA